MGKLVKIGNISLNCWIDQEYISYTYYTTIHKIYIKIYLYYRAIKLCDSR